MSWLKKYFLVLLAVVLLCFTACSSEEAAQTPGEDDVVIGSVNGVDLYRSEFESCFNALFTDEYDSYYLTYLYYYDLDLLDEDSCGEYLPYMEMDAWNMVIENELLIQLAASEYDLVFTDNYLQDMLNYGDYKALQVQNLYHYMFLQEEQEMEDALEISEEELLATYDADPAGWEGRATSQILITCDVEDTAALAEAEATAEDLIAQLQSGADFATLAEEYAAEGSPAGGALDLYLNPYGYEMGTTTSYLSEYVDATFALEKVGDYTKTPVYTDQGYYIIKLDDVIGAYEEVREYVEQSLRVVAEEDVHNSITDKLTALYDAASIVDNMDYRFYDPSAAE